MGVNSLPKTITRQRRGCDLNPGPSAPESSTLPTRLPLLSITTVSCAKTAEPIEMPFGVRTRVGPGNQALDGGPNPPPNT